MPFYFGWQLTYSPWFHWILMRSFFGWLSLSWTKFFIFLVIDLKAYRVTNGDFQKIRMSSKNKDILFVVLSAMLTTDNKTYKSFIIFTVFILQKKSNFPNMRQRIVTGLDKYSQKKQHFTRNMNGLHNRIHWPLNFLYSFYFCIWFSTNLMLEKMGMVQQIYYWTHNLKSSMVGWLDSSFRSERSLGWILLYQKTCEDSKDFIGVLIS